MDDRDDPSEPADSPGSGSTDGPDADATTPGGDGEAAPTTVDGDVAPPSADGDVAPTTADGHRLATLCLPVVDGEVLLIYKKRGIGAGLYNGPGGKVEPGETPRECAIRETHEEVRATPTGVRKLGELDFRFGEDPFTYVHVFRAEGLEREPVETPEARPEWFPLEAIPYDEMWDDDRYWLPHLLDGEPFFGTFRFDEEGDRLLEWNLETDVEP